MKKSYFFYLLFAASFFISCESDTSTSAKNIDETADNVKSVIDLFEGKAKKFLEEGGMDKIKEVVDEVADKSQEINKDSPIWKEKLEEVKKDKEVMDLVEKYEGDGNAALDKIMDALKDIENEGDIKDGIVKISKEKDVKELLEKHNGDASKIFKELEGEIEGLKDNPVVKRKIEEFKNDKEIKELLKKYEQDGKDILKKIEDIFKSLEDS